MPRIYVASLADYNCGQLHGVQIEVDNDTDLEEVNNEIEAMLEQSPSVANGDTELAEEIAIHDYDGFYGYRLHEYTPIAKALAIGAAIATHGEPLAAWLALGILPDFEEAIRKFEDVSCGVWPSREDWAEQDFGDHHTEAALTVFAYSSVTFDAADYVLIAEANRGYSFEDLSDGSVAVFHPESA